MDNTISRSNNKAYETLLKKLPLALVGIALVGFGLAFNSAGMLGNDAVAVLYDGVRNIIGLPIEKLGLVTNMVNIVFVAIVFMVNRKYINIGTFIYALPLGNFVSLGFKIHDILNIPSSLTGRILTSFCGCSMLFLGVGIFIAMDIGMDPCTGVVMLIRDKINSQYKTAKIYFDICSIIIGFAFGGKVGVVTVIAAFMAGPTIQKISEVFDKTVLKSLKLSKLAVNS
ncbi:YczE/YyaS/YitT family protein [Candidatus Clostridium stratigraminis]|uniref:YitT family protein n=1 Tax=Candidatus Clostridium stratigraminis TaxID=3381661 RepID=A0ABW8T459_9CLOT